MKKRYQVPNLEEIEIHVGEVITTSGGERLENGGLNGVGQEESLDSLFPSF